MVLDHGADLVQSPLLCWSTTKGEGGPRVKIAFGCVARVDAEMTFHRTSACRRHQSIARPNQGAYSAGTKLAYYHGDRA